MQLNLSGLSFDAASSLIDSRYPCVLTDPMIASVVQGVIAQRVSGTLLVSDLGCGQSPVSSQVLSSPQFDARFMAVDSDGSGTSEDIDFIQVGRTSAYVRDIQDFRAMRVAKRDFFDKNRSLGKNKFDVIFLSNILNYITGESEKLGPGEVSKSVSMFVEKIVAKNLSRKGVLVIQNGDKTQTDTRCDQGEVNEYFSEEMEAVLGKYFTDTFYLGLAAMNPPSKGLMSGFKNLFSKDTVAPIESFSSLERFCELQKREEFITGVSVRCMIPKNSK